MSGTEKIARRAAMLAIGDELLSGKTQDTNIHYLAHWLAQRGVTLCEARIVADIPEAIIAAVHQLRQSYDYVFTSGGIGPTHDDITAETKAAAFAVDISIRQDARDLLQKYYDAKGQSLNDARLRMARIPDGARLILNNVSGAPGFQLENIFVMAGVPQVFQAMLEDIETKIDHGPILNAMTIRGCVPESTIADGLALLQARYEDISIGSYPGKTVTGYGVAVVIRGLNQTHVKIIAAEVLKLMQHYDKQAELVTGEASAEPA